MHRFSLRTTDRSQVLDITADVEAALNKMGVARAKTVLGHRVAYADTLGAGKGVLVHRLNEWMDPRGIETNTFWEHSDEEESRPYFWRFWRQPT